MVYETADRRIYISGGHGTHQIKSYINHVHIRRVCTNIFYHTFNKSFTKGSSTIANRFSCQVFRSGNIFIFQRKDNAQWRLHDRTDSLHRCFLIGNGLNYVMLIIHTNLSFTCCY